MDKNKDQQPDRTVLGAERSLAILSAFNDTNSALTLKELEQKTGLFKSVICRYMISFTKYGYITQRPDHSYQLGPQIFRLGKTFEQQFNYGDTINPILTEMVEKTKESAAFFIKQNNQRLCLFAVDSYEPVKAIVKTGSMYPLDDTSSAQVLRFFSDPQKIYASHGQYICSSSGINNALSSSMSIPVFGYGNAFMGALTIYGISLRFNPFSDEEIRITLLSLAQKLSAQLGATEAYKNASPDIFDALSLLNTEPVQA